jgi:hypothetical protein
MPAFWQVPIADEHVHVPGFLSLQCGPDGQLLDREFRLLVRVEIALLVPLFGRSRRAIRAEQPVSERTGVEEVALGVGDGDALGDVVEDGPDEAPVPDLEELLVQLRRRAGRWCGGHRFLRDERSRDRSLAEQIQDRGRTTALEAC